MSILHIDSSARLEGSITRIISEYLVQALQATSVHRDLAYDSLPEISPQDLMGVHGSLDDHRASLEAQLALSKGLIQELKAAKILVIGAPMYNFGIPASLKRWIDAICRAGVSFKYTNAGPVGLLDIERAYIITATGGTQVGGNMDFVSGYLQQICHFIGVKDVLHIDASGSKGSSQEIIASAKVQVDTLLGEKQVSNNRGVA